MSSTILSYFAVAQLVKQLGKISYWMVVATNAIGDAVSSTVYSFKTLLPSLIYETFGNSLGYDHPQNWTKFIGELFHPSYLTPYEYVWLLNNWANVLAPPANISANFSFYDNHHEWLITPALELGGAPYQLQFDIALTSRGSNNPITSNPNGTTGIDDRFLVLIGDGSSWTPANILREWNNTGSTYVLNDIPHTGLHVTIPLNAYTGIQYIAFYGATTEDNANNDFFVDNVHVYIPYPHDLAAQYLSGQLTGPIGTPVTHTVTVKNFGSDIEAAYTVNLKSLSPAVTLATLNVSTPLAAGATTTHPITWIPTHPGIESELYAEIVLATDQEPINNISPSLVFYSHIPGTLTEGFEAGIPANWTVLNADSSYYTWDYLNYLQHSGFSTASVLADADPRSDDWLITPPLQLSTQLTDTISFWMAGISPSFQEEWEVLISTTDTQPASFAMIDSGVITSEGYNLYNYNLDSYGDAIVYFAIRYRSYYGIGIALLIDDFRGPLIYVPTALNTPQLTITSSGSGIVLNWDAIPFATEYRVFASDNPYSWPANYSTVNAPTHSYSFYASAVNSMFFKVVALTGPSQALPTATKPLGEAKGYIDIMKARYKDKRY